LRIWVRVESLCNRSEVELGLLYAMRRQYNLNSSVMSIPPQPAACGVPRFRQQARRLRRWEPFAARKLLRI
jgi:hypothetical protein